MIKMNDVTFYSPKEISDSCLIVNRKGKGDYGFVLRLIKNGKLEANVFNEDSKIPYYLVSKQSINDYNNRFNT